MTVAARVATYQSGPSFMALARDRLTVTDGFITLDGHPVVFQVGTAVWDGERLTYFGCSYELGDRIDVCGGGASLYQVRKNTHGLKVPDHWAEDDPVFIAAG